jgi:hypothetical protein
MAFMIGSPDAKYFLDIDSGELEYLSYLDDEEAKDALLKRTEDDNWVEIPRASTREGMLEIQAFIDSEEDAEVKAELESSQKESNPLLAFNRALGGATPARKRWTLARINSMHGRLLDFCDAHELVVDDERFHEVKASLVL